MADYLTEEMIKEMWERKKYYREHPEESHKAWLKRDDGIGMVLVEKPKDKESK